PPGRLLTVATGLGAPGQGCGMPPSAWCQDWMTALRCGALGRCPHLTQGNPEVDICAVCQQLFNFLRQASNQSTVEVVLDQVVGILSPHPPVTMTPCQGLLHVLIDHPLWQIQHLLKWQWRHTARGFGDTVCATLKLCHGERGAAPAVPVLEALGTHLQGSGGAGLSPKALPLPLCWLCRTL
ncbi:PSPB protein, partial [Sterrhoptilus dennistouni]|nr:PSPB protein [Sterrhoptilus dennistouni]